jgi:hypothetical protein
MTVDQSSWILIFRFDMILVIIHDEGWPSSMTIVGVSALANSSFLDILFISIGGGAAFSFPNGCPLFKARLLHVVFNICDFCFSSAIHCFANFDE